MHCIGGNLTDFPAVEEFLKSVKIWRNRSHNIVASFFRHGAFHVFPMFAPVDILLLVTFLQYWRLTNDAPALCYAGCHSLQRPAENHPCSMRCTPRCRKLTKKSSLSYVLTDHDFTFLRWCFFVCFLYAIGSRVCRRTRHILKVYVSCI